MKRLAAVVPALLACALSAAPQQAAGNRITVDVSRVKCEAARDLWGIFFEDIDLSLDGGVYAELVRNCSFEDEPGGRDEAVLQNWQTVGRADARRDRSHPLSGTNRSCAKVVAAPGGGVANSGYFGIAVEKGKKYNLSFMARGNSRLEIALERYGASPVAVQTAKLASDDEWRQYELALVASDADANCRLVFRAPEGGAFWLDCVSLMPEDAVCGIFRRDLMEKLAALKPRFVRFPGGCWVEGTTMKEAYRWKKTIVPRWERTPQWNLWKYWSSNFTGFYEYLLLSEALGAKPLFCINAGISHKDEIPMEEMDEFVQDALDCIEFCNGGVDTTWGKVRAEMGHPAPFNLEYLEVGNENWGAKYDERYALFYDAIRAKYPDVKIIGDWFGNWEVKSRPMDLRDDHFYMTPDWFMSCGQKHYANGVPKAKDAADVGGVFVGEYAVTRRTGPYGSLRGAIGEAAFMTAIESQGDTVKLAAYAPLFANVRHSTWTPNLIYVQPDSSFGSPSYEVQRLFAENRASKILHCEVASEKIAISGDPKAKDEKGVPSETDAIVANAAISEDGKALVVKVVNCAGKEVTATLEIAGATLAGVAKCTVFPAPAEPHEAMSANTPADPAALTSHSSLLASGSSLVLAPLSLNIYRFPLADRTQKGQKQ